jgi:hypothetical protein
MANARDQPAIREVMKVSSPPAYLGLVDSGTRRNALSKADLDVSAKLPE